MTPLDPETWQWWTLLRGVAVLNCAAWMALAVWLWRRRTDWPPSAWEGRGWQLLLSGGYVLGCAWRSMLPVFDVPRLVLVDSFWSSVLVGRSVATVAELCLAAQWALLLRHAARDAGSTRVLRLSQAVLPLIALAEMCSWHAVLTTANLGHVIEEALWGVSAVLVVVGLLSLWPRTLPSMRPMLALWCLAGGLYALYMAFVDVPMYWARWLADEAAGRAYLDVAQGWADTAGRWQVDGRWHIWRTEWVWMTAYFSVAVWTSLALVAAPRWQPHAAGPVPAAAVR